MDALFVISQLDHAILQAIQANISPLVAIMFLFFTFFGNPIFWIGIAAALYWRGQENRGFFLMNLVLFTAAVVGAIKHSVARPRPGAAEFQVLGKDAYVEPGFPSGHSALIAAVFSYTYKRIKKSEKFLLVVLVALVALSRLYLGMHFPSDVIAGLGIGLLIGKANLFARNKLFHRNFKPSKIEDELALIGLVAIAVLAIVFLRSLPMAGIFIGFYAGFFLFKEMQLSQSILMRKMLGAKYAAGFALLIALFLAGEGIVFFGIAFTELQRFGLYLLGGFWISWLWPVLFERAFRAKTIT